MRGGFQRALVHWPFRGRNKKVDLSAGTEVTAGYRKAGAGQQRGGNRADSRGWSRSDEGIGKSANVNRAPSGRQIETCPGLKAGDSAVVIVTLGDVAEA